MTHFWWIIGCLAVCFILLTYSPAHAQPQLKDPIDAYLNTLPATAKVSLEIKSLGADSATYSLRADERVPSASVIKIPIMVEAMERAKAGLLDLSEIHILLDAEKVGGSGVLNGYSHRSRISYADLLRLMMVYSDNTATNIFINEMGKEAINARMRALGLPKSQLNRLMMDTLAARQGRDNYVTAHEMNRLLADLYQKRVATPDLCEQMIGVLKENADTLTLTRQLPKTVAVAHKTGGLPYVRGDAAIIYARRPFLVSVFVEGVPTPDAEQIIGRIGRLGFDYFDRP